MLSMPMASITTYRFMASKARAPSHRSSLNSRNMYLPANRCFYFLKTSQIEPVQDKNGDSHLHTGFLVLSKTMSDNTKYLIETNS